LARRLGIEPSSDRLTACSHTLCVTTNLDTKKALRSQPEGLRVYVIQIENNLPIPSWVWLLF